MWKFAVFFLTGSFWPIKVLFQMCMNLSQQSFLEHEGCTGVFETFFTFCCLSFLKIDAGFAITAISRTPGVTYNESFDLQCIIKPHYPSWVPVSVTWRFQPAGSTEFHNLVTFTRDGGVQWGDKYIGFRTRTAIEKSESSNNVRLSISRASDTEAGKYQCVAELWRKNYNSSWTRLADRISNLLEIRVLRPGECSVGGTSKKHLHWENLLLLENQITHSLLVLAF